MIIKQVSFLAHVFIALSAFFMSLEIGFSHRIIFTPAFDDKIIFSACELSSVAITTTSGNVFSNKVLTESYLDIEG